MKDAKERAIRVVVAKMVIGVNGEATPSNGTIYLRIYINKGGHSLFKVMS